MRWWWQQSREVTREQGETDQYIHRLEQRTQKAIDRLQLVIKDLEKGIAEPDKRGTDE